MLNDQKIKGLSKKEEELPRNHLGWEVATGPSPDFLKNKGAARLEKALMARAIALRNWRKLRGLTKIELANLVACHSNTIALWEQGKVIPSWALEKLVKLGFPEKATQVLVK